MAKPAASKSPRAQTSSKPKSSEQENFERELKDLAAKAREETWSKWALEQLWVLTQSATLLALAAIYSNLSQLTLSPVYGSIPSSIYHQKGVMAACFLGWSSNLYIKRNLPVKPTLLLPVIAAYIPMLQFFLCKFSEHLGGRWGPVVTESLTFFPLLLLSVSCTATILDDLELSNGRFKFISDAMPGIGSFVFYKVMGYFAGRSIQRSIGSSLLHSRIGFQVILSGLYTLFAPSKLVLYAIPALLHTAFLNSHVPSTSMTTSLNQTMQSKGWSILDRRESVTGYLSVIESSQKGYRVMRCDHSLLGGEWLPVTTRSGRTEPIYGIFVMLEAVRLIEIPNPVPDHDAKALVVGLGIGTTPTALAAHGINTTFVEIDPVVYEFATKYFALPKKLNPVIADAVSYTSALAKTNDKYDYVVHDVFTGGAEPVDLFTVEFIQNLKSILKPNGVIAINYAGDLLLPAARVVIHTILSVFPTCRIYRESPSTATTSTPGVDFTNMVIFCTNAPSASSSSPETDDATPPGITFRAPVDSDLLDSGARRMFLLPKHEIPLAEFGTREELDASDGGILYANATERFRDWHQSSALGHWGVMRTVIPPEVWEGW